MQVSTSRRYQLPDHLTPEMVHGLLAGIRKDAKARGVIKPKVREVHAMHEGDDQRCENCKTSLGSVREPLRTRPVHPLATGALLIGALFYDAITLLLSRTPMATSWLYCRALSPCAQLAAFNRPTRHSTALRMNSTAEVLSSSLSCSSSFSSSCWRRRALAAPCPRLQYPLQLQPSPLGRLCSHLLLDHHHHQCTTQQSLDLLWMQSLSLQAHGRTV